MTAARKTKRFAVLLICTLAASVAGYLLMKWVSGRNVSALCQNQDISIRLNDGGGYLTYKFFREGKVKLNLAALLPLPNAVEKKPTPSSDSIADIQSEEEGTLRLKPYLQNGNVWTMGAMIIDHKYQNNNSNSNGNNDKTAADGASTNKISPCPFLFEMNSKGEISNIRFGASRAEPERLHILSLLYEFQFIFPPTPGCGWKTAQRDAMGEYEASYEIVGMAKNEKSIRITRVITEYKNNELAKTKFSPAAMAAKIIIENDHTEAEIQTDGDWLTTINHRQSTKIVSNGTKIGESNTRFKTERLISAPGGVFPESVAALQEMMAACIKEKQTQNLYQTDPELNAMAEGRDLPGAIELFLKKRGKDGYLESKQAEMFLVNFLKLHPKETFGIIGFIDKRKTNHLTDKEELALWNVITLAGHHEAQQAIMDAINSSTFDAQTRLTAAMHLFNLASPEPFLVDALWKTQQIGAADEGNPQELQLKHTALFALGVMAGNVNISEDLRASIMSNLSKQLRNAANPQATGDALIAMGNSRRPEFLQQAESYLTNADTTIRISAYGAISKLENPGAFDIITENFPTEKNMSVKASILKAIGDIPPSEKIMEFCRKEAETETNNNLLIPIADSLAKNARDYPDNKQALKTIIEKKPSGQVLRAIYRYVSPDYLKN